MIYAWTRPSGAWAIRLEDRVPGNWPKVGGSAAAQIESAVLVANENLGTDFTEDEARQIAQRLAKRVRKGARYAPAKYTRR